MPLNGIITRGGAVKAFAAMLCSEGLVSINRIKAVLFEITGGAINLPGGTVAKRDKGLSGKLAPFIEKIKEKLPAQPVLRKGETGIGAGNRLQRLHVPGNGVYTPYFPAENAAMKRAGKPAYGGVPARGRLKGLYGFACGHAECNAHILRYLKPVEETYKRVRAASMTAFLANAVKGHKASNCTALGEAAIAECRARYDEVLGQGRVEFLQCGKKDYNGEGMKLLRRLKECKRGHLRFPSDFQAPFGNNLAGRDLRVMKGKTKASGCFRGGKGGSVFAAIKSCASTLRKNSRNIFDGLKAAFLGVPFSWA
jgi:hypothetical protein